MHSCGSLFRHSPVHSLLVSPLSDLIRLSGREDVQAAEEKQGGLPHGFSDVNSDSIGSLLSVSLEVACK